METPLKGLTPIILLTGLIPSVVFADKYEPNWESLSQHNPTPEWFRDAKFGVYTHWGVYSVPAFGNEWYPAHMYQPDPDSAKEKQAKKGVTGDPKWTTKMVRGVPIRHYEGFYERDFEKRYCYEFHVKHFGHPTQFGYKDFIPLFKAEKFNADEWADLFEKSGAKFAGTVTEHHDGFAMWDSELTPFCAGKAGPKKDIIGELEKTIRSRGMKFIATMHHARNKEHFEGPKDDPTYDLSDPKYAKLYGTLPPEEFEQLWLDKLKEVINKYEPDMIWFDSCLGTMSEKKRQEFAAYYLNQADGWDRDVMITYKKHDMPMSVATLDHERGAEKASTPYPWLSDDCVSPHTWSYVEDMEFYPVEHILHGFIDTVSKNGQLLLNITPKASGEIPEECKHILLEMGDWLRLNGEGIYNTRPWVIAGEGGLINFTRSKDGQYIYVFTTTWPGETLTVKSLGKNSATCPWEVAAVSCLATGKPLDFTREDSALKINTGTREGKYAWGFKVELKDVKLEDLNKLCEAEHKKNAKYFTYGKTKKEMVK